MKLANPGFGFIRTAAASPVTVLGDISQTRQNIAKMADKASHGSDGARLIVLPELCLAGGYTSADLFHQTVLQERTLDELEQLVCDSVRMDCVMAVGLPLRVGGNLFNVAAVIDRGKIAGIVPKSYLPTGGEFQEARWFGTADDLTVREIELFGKTVPIGADLLFRSKEDPNAVFGIELCEDLWTPLPPSSFMAAAGATIILNLSASNELVGKASYRRDLIVQQSGRCIAGYVYASSGAGESTTDLVFGGHCLIAENGSLIGENERFKQSGSITIRDLDPAACIHDRQRTPSFGKCARELRSRPGYRSIAVGLEPRLPDTRNLERPNNAYPFVPKSPADQETVCSEVFSIQTAGLIGRLKRTGSKTVVLGLSGGLDSTLVLLACCDAFDQLGYDRKDIRAVTMPGMGTTEGTKTSAYALAKEAGVTLEEIPIGKGAKLSLKDIGHGGAEQDVTYENAQARYRTLILMQKANQLQGIVAGTGDLSEAALGWCTYNGDHMSHYNVNCSVPKTLVRFVVRWFAEHKAKDGMKRALIKVLETPVSPELKKPKKGQIAQKTEELIGPYDLHDFFLYHVVRKGTRPRKILYLAAQAFEGRFDGDEIRKWLELFLKRFFHNQFKRSSMPDGPKVGSVSLSQRGDWRMPSDAWPDAWIQDLDGARFGL